MGLLKVTVIIFCRFQIYVGMRFTTSKKQGECGNAFNVTSERGQLGHLQSELVDPLSLTIYMPKDAILGAYSQQLVDCKM